MTTTRRTVLAGGGLLTSAALLRDIPTTAAQPSKQALRPSLPQLRSKLRSMPTSTATRWSPWR
jgi:hypothetical protein